MQQILFEIPLHSWFGVFYDIPVHGYGFMLFLAFVFTTRLAAYLSKKQGMPPEVIQDLAIFLFVFGILGARVTYVIQFWHKYQDNPLGLTFRDGWPEFSGGVFAIWDGGLVFYGSAIGGFLGFVAAYYFILRKQRINFFKMADVVAPCLALGLAFGRIGCLLNGCCYGGVACEDCWAVHFPLSAEPRQVLVSKGYQTPAGFTLDLSKEPRVNKVREKSGGAILGLQEGDIVVKVGTTPVNSVADVLAAEHAWGGPTSECYVLRPSTGKELKISLSQIKFSTAISFLTACDIGTAYVDRVEPGSLAAESGLRDGDKIIEAEGKRIYTLGDLIRLFRYAWERGDNDLDLKVQRADTNEIDVIPAFAPRTIGIHPTQVYETISTVLIMIFLLSYLPFRRHNGELLVLMMILYSIHRFTNEIIRIDTKPEGGGLTLSQTISVAVFALGIGVGIWLWQKPPEYGPGAPEPKPEPEDAPEPTPKVDIPPETAVQD